MPAHPRLRHPAALGELGDPQLSGGEQFHHRQAGGVGETFKEDTEVVGAGGDGSGEGQTGPRRPVRKQGGQNLYPFD